MFGGQGDGRQKRSEYQNSVGSHNALDVGMLTSLLFHWCNQVYFDPARGLGVIFGC